ncbi:MAG: tetratricopeptide repeat protein [Nitrospira sp.]|nr:tetratricopeptide repeat protein [Nitrospira sp.]
MDMSYRIKVPPRSLPVAEGQLVSTLEERLIGLKVYRVPFIVGLVVLLLVCGLIGGIVWYDARNAGKAQDLEREATLQYLARPANDPKKIETNLKEAIRLYQQIADEYPRTPSAPLALFGLGNALIETNQLDSAIEAYKRFLATYSSNASLAGLVRQKLAYVYLSKGDQAQATAAYSAVIDSPGSLNRDQALFELARIEEGQSRREGALQRYQELIKTYPKSPFANEAAIREKVFDMKKPAEVSPVPVPVPDAPRSPASSKSLAKP